MSIIETLGAQGEIRCFRVDRLPDQDKLVPVEDRVIGHSETGHHHVLEAERVKVWESTDHPEGMRVLYALLESPGDLIHHRDEHTHQSHHFEPGIYMFRTDREFDPFSRSARMSAD
jgi:hypothetical protein